MASLRVSLRQPPAWSTMRSTFPRPTVGRRNAKNAKQKILESLQATFASFLHPLPVRLAIFTHAPNRKNSHQRHARRIVDLNCWLVESVVVNGCRRGTLQNHWVQLCLELELGVTPRLSETINPVVNLAGAKNDCRLRRFGRFQKSHEIPKSSDWCHDLPRGSLLSLSLGFRAAMQRSMSYKTLRLCDEQQRPKSSKNSRVRRGYSKFWVSGISGALGALPMAECEDLWWNWNAVASNLLKHLQMNSQEEQLVNYSYLFSFKCASLIGQNMQPLVSQEWTHINACWQATHTWQKLDTSCWEHVPAALQFLQSLLCLQAAIPPFVSRFFWLVQAIRNSSQSGSSLFTRGRMARERRGAGSSLVSMETPYYKTIY